MKKEILNIKHIRYDFSDIATESRILVDKEPECYAIEDKDRYLEEGGIKVQGQTAIPRGTYKVTITFSNRFQREMPELHDVPGFTGVRIHSGNKSEDTEGCIITGAVNAKESDNFVGSSRLAYKRLMAKIKKAISEGKEVYYQIV